MILVDRVKHYLEYIDLNGFVQFHRQTWDDWNTAGKVVFLVPYLVGWILLPVVAVCLTPILKLLMKRG